jgi:hypothetical protein
MTHHEVARIQLALHSGSDGLNDKRDRVRAALSEISRSQSLVGVNFAGFR